jgi:hypothetical protein
MRLTCPERARALASRAIAFIALGLFVCLPHVARAQANNGALDLLLPLGARATALGGAFVAEQGSEAIWWNPAGIARLTKPEFGLDHFDTFLSKGDAVSFVVPVPKVGVLGVSGRVFNYGSQDSTDGTGQLFGSILMRTVMIGATFAAPFGPNITGGVTYHLYQNRSDCSGQCTTDVATTSALDAGVQLRPFPGRPLILGVEIRNLGPTTQVRDAAQSDPLPTRFHVGASYEPSFPQFSKDLQVRMTTEVVTTSSLQLPEFRAGAQIGYVTAQSTLLARAGYTYQPTIESSAGGPSLGLGLAQGRVSLDITRVFESFSTGVGKPPTFISIRVGL